jgi:uncharacterized protein (DUF1778 family)
MKHYQLVIDEALKKKLKAWAALSGKKSMKDFIVEAIKEKAERENLK